MAIQRNNSGGAFRRDIHCSHKSTLETRPFRHRKQLHRDTAHTRIRLLNNTMRIKHEVTKSMIPTLHAAVKTCVTTLSKTIAHLEHVSIGPYSAKMHCTEVSLVLVNIIPRQEVRHSYNCNISEVMMIKFFVSMLRYLPIITWLHQIRSCNRHTGCMQNVTRVWYHWLMLPSRFATRDRLTKTFVWDDGTTASTCHHRLVQTWNTVLYHFPSHRTIRHDDMSSQ